ISRSLEITCGTKLTIPLNDTGHFVLIASIQRTSLFLSVCYRRNAHGTPELAKAFAYALNQWPALTYYADDGWAEADNNIAENALRMVSLGRKNYLFFGSDHGGERGALLYSLIGTCKLNGVEPESYLRYVLDVIADWPINRVGELLPWRVALPTE
ncbi:IS66 family transposase, partial [Escherichia coli]|uniref:IS66 family transposase n=2 Tax=Escherichia coli TaxID=562 RepID=UPI00201A64BA